MQRCFVGLHKKIFGPGHSPITVQVFYEEWRGGSGGGQMGRIGLQTKGTRVLCWEEVGGVSIWFVGAMDDHSPVTNFCTKSYTIRQPEEYLQEQCAVKMLSADVKEG